MGAQVEVRCWDRLGTVLGPFWKRFCHHFGNVFGIILEPFLQSFAMLFVFLLGSFWDCFGFVLA